MNPVRRLVLAIAVSTLAPLASSGQARAEDWTITSFDVAVVMEADGSLDVTETIAVRFDAPRHGIFREIPVRYAVGMHLYDIRLHLSSVTDSNGASLKYTVKDESNKTVIRVGDAKKTVTGPQTYVFKYRVGRAVLWEGDHAVLRWNATGTAWQVPIERAGVTVTLPAPLDDARVNYDAYAGRFGTAEKRFRKERVDEKTLRFAAGPFAPGEGITVEIAVPAGVVKRPTYWAELAWWVEDNFPYAFMPLGLAACLGAWYFRGRDLPGMGSIVVRYEPPRGLCPAEVGTLADEKVDLRDVSATIVDLAVRGYLSIEELKTSSFLGLGKSNDYRIIKRKMPEGLKFYELRLYNQLFASGGEVLLSDLRYKFYAILPSVKSDLYESLSTGGYFDGRPDRVKSGFFVLGLIVLGVVLGLSALVQSYLIGRVFPLPLILTGIFLLIVLAVTSQVMPRRTRQGRIAWEEIRGLEEYISRAEVDDLKTQEKQAVFERLLPYAVTFGLTKRWAKAFEGLYTEPPDWYHPYGDGPFSMVYFGNSVDNSVSAMNSTLPSQPRSEGGSGGGGEGGWSSGGFGGGGDVGGGFGGGGGGDW
ncbi:MAG: DUF2207 domain-containing protein [Isosphaeraceae bacterium]